MGLEFYFLSEPSSISMFFVYVRGFDSGESMPIMADPESFVGGVQL